MDGVAVEVVDEVIIMGLPHGLDPLSSRLIVGELVRRLGDARVADVLRIPPSRIAVLVQGRGRLSDEQVDRIAVGTGRTCPLWLLDAGEHQAGTDRQQAAIADGRVMRDHYERSAAAEIARAQAALTRVKAGPRVDRAPVRTPRRRSSKPAA